MSEASTPVARIAVGVGCHRGCVRARPSCAGSGRTRLIETTLLVLAGLLLAIATVNDVARQTHVNHRLIADLRTWRAYTGHDYHNLSISQQLLGEASRREVVCGNTSPGPPKATHAAVPCDLGAGRGRPAHGPRRLVPAAAGRGPARACATAASGRPAGGSARDERRRPAGARPGGSAERRARPLVAAGWR